MWCCAVEEKVEKSSNGSLIFPKIREEKVSSSLTKTFDGKGLEPWYDVAKSFIHTVQKDDLPYGMLKYVVYMLYNNFVSS